VEGAGQKFQVLHWKEGEKKTTPSPLTYFMCVVFFSLRDNHRPVRLDLAVLDAEDRVCKALGQLAGLAGRVGGVERDSHILALIVDGLDGRDDGRRTRAKHLDQALLLHGLAHLLHRVHTLRHLELVPLARQLEDGRARDTRQDCAVEGGGDQFLFCKKKKKKKKKEDD